MSLHVILLYTLMGHKKEALWGLCTVCAAVGLSVLLSGHCVLSGCQAAVTQAVTLGLTATGRLACQALLSGSCQIRAVRLSEKVLSALSGCRALSGAVRGLLSGCQTRAQPREI